LTHDELWRLAGVVDGATDRLPVLVAGYCGLRWNELAALRWSDVDLQSRTLRVVRAYSEEAPRGELSPVKNHQARTVPIPEIASGELAEYKALQPKVNWSFLPEQAQRWLAGVGIRRPLVVPHRSG
jgi:integrase